ncbi:hypothetical protein M2132_000822 [Dysgonomonas sp. PH5-45]|uniref:hypothetical protein n=1 Tax=unclassified Dysgonomonas TaxID=2630389 RepID=UPI002476467E|nr:MULTISPECIES: hypothetical protein [unclassified Dysgonomonas]MDH6354494.1 hypothetical protein [Dysgonomonas sp. PH5-45]MDH6387449.1 hypothetical protein [Dysgonomonas sp. PH5-37]
MASTGQDFIKNLTPDNGAVTNLRELLFLSVLQSEAIEKVLTVQPGAIHGKKIGGIGNMGLVGEIQNACRPQFNATAIATQEKEWDLGEFTVAEEICYKDLKETLVRYAMRTKTSVADLTGTDYIDLIVEPRLREALTRMLWRLFWFGDKDAKNVSAGGIVTDTVDTKYFDVCDGLFKRLFALTAANPDQHVEIDANGSATYKAQRDDLRAAGVATAIFDDLIYNADMRLRQASDKVVLATQSFADALAIDVKRTTGSDLQWESLFDGFISATKFNGQEIIALPIWDDMIAAFEDNGTTYNKPHRVVYASRSALWAGVASENLVGELDIWFSKDDQVNRMLVRDEIGTLVWENDLVRFGY